MKSIICGTKKVTPSKILCVGRNYVEHITELGNEVPENMVVFAKPNSAISDALHSTHLKEKLHYEGEICFMIENGQPAAVGFGLDLTKRETQAALKNKGLPWERAKAFDGAALFSEFVPVTGGNAEITIKLFINQELRQHGSTAQMMYKPADILAELKTFSTLEDGDIIMTGTPSGVGTVETGDLFRGVIFLGDEELVSKSWQAQP